MQLRNTVHVVLIELHLERAEMSLGPLRQTPFLDHQGVRLEFDVFADDVAVEDGEFPTDVGAFELTGRPAREDGNALGICEGVEQFLGGGAELVRGCYGGGVDGDFTGGCGGGSFGGWGFLLRGLGVVGWCAKPAGRVGARGVLDVLPVLLNQRWSERD